MDGQEAWGIGHEGDAVQEAVRSFEDLRVWNDAVQLAVALYSVTRAFPSDEQFGLTSQLRRAGVSIPSNIAEGWGRGSRGDYARFLKVARGSLYEVRTQLVIAREIGLLATSDTDALNRQVEAVCRQLQALIGAVERSG